MNRRIATSAVVALPVSVSQRCSPGTTLQLRYNPPWPSRFGRPQWAAGSEHPPGQSAQSIPRGQPS